MKFGADECCQAAQCLKNEANKLNEYPKNHRADLNKLDSEHGKIFHKSPEAAVQADECARKTQIRLQEYRQEYEHDQRKSGS